MTRSLLILANLFLLFPSFARAQYDPRLGPPPTVIQLAAADGKTVYGDFYSSGKTQSKTVLLMFHQAGSNAAEYATIAPQMAKAGYDCLAIDQRSGGRRFGRENRTADGASPTNDYMAAYADLQGAVAWAQHLHYQNIVPWGSSYSASLTLKLLSENPNLPCGLVFSPGEYFDDKTLVRTWASRVKVPVFFVCTPDEAHQGRKALFDALGSEKDSEWICFPGSIHGSSTAIQRYSPVAGMIIYRAKQFLKILSK